MKRFCQECGHEAALSDNMCSNCGTELIKLEQQQEAIRQPESEVKPQIVKKFLSKKQKIIVSVVGALAILLISFSVWANMYFSKDSTENRFNKAVEDQDATKLESLLMHEDSSAVTSKEVEAFLKLANDLSDDELKDLVSVEPEGRFLGIFQMHKVSAADQFAYYYGPTSGLGMNFNLAEVQNQVDSDGITYGPLLPGIYTVTISLNNDFGESQLEVELTLADPNSYEVLMDSLPIGEARVNISNYDRDLMSETHLLINDKKVEIDEYGDSEEFGPLFLDGSTEAKVVTNYPWGEVTSKPFSINANDVEVDATFVNDEEFTEIKETLLTFGEEMQNAKTQLSTDVFTSATTILRDDFLNYEINPLIESNVFYTGKLNKMNINADSIFFHNGLLMIHSMFDYSYAFYGEGEEPPALEDVELHSYVGLAYDSTEQDWKVSYIEVTLHDPVEPTDTINGSGTVYEPSEESFQVSQTGSVRAEIQEFMENYTIANIDAINLRDVEYIRSFVTSDGPRFDEAKNYIVYLEKNNITEEYISTAVVNIVEQGNATYLVTTLEDFTIIYPDSEEQKTFETVTEVRMENGTWKVHELISTTEI